MNGGDTFIIDHSSSLLWWTQRCHKRQ